MIFEKPSLRTRVTFEVGIQSLGGTAIYLDHADTHLGDRESIPDVGRCLSRWVQGIVARVFSQEALEELACVCFVPVVNALSDRLSSVPDAMRFFHARRKIRSARGLKLAYVGDGNNVCHSLMIAGARVGAHVRVAHPRAMSPMRKSSRRRGACGQANARHDRIASARRKKPFPARKRLHRRVGQHGPGSETDARAAIFAPYQVNAN
jgi:ornithine carbamoyltransferase